MANNDDQIVSEPTAAEILNGMGAFELLAYMETRPDFWFIWKMTNQVRPQIEAGLAELSSLIQTRINEMEAEIAEAGCLSEADGAYLRQVVEGMLVNGQTLSDTPGVTLSGMMDQVSAFVQVAEENTGNSDDTLGA